MYILNLKPSIMTVQTISFNEWKFHSKLVILLTADYLRNGLLSYFGGKISFPCLK